MKEFIKREKEIGKYEYGYKLQKLDIKMMIELGLEVPNKFKEIYEKDNFESNLSDYVIFTGPIETEFISRQYYLRDYLEFSNLNIFELDLLIYKYDEMIKELENNIKNINNKDDLIELETNLKILINEKQGIIYLKEKLTKEEEKIRK